MFEGKDHILIAGCQIEFVDWGYWSPQMPPSTGKASGTARNSQCTALSIALNRK
ncbi:hypothetical protein ALT721_510017 [Alteromonas alvinellae]